MLRALRLRGVRRARADARAGGVEEAFLARLGFARQKTQERVAPPSSAPSAAASRGDDDAARGGGVIRVVRALALWEVREAPQSTL